MMDFIVLGAFVAFLIFMLRGVAVQTLQKDEKRREKYNKKDKNE